MNEWVANVIQPNLIKRGDTIAFIAPASACEVAELDKVKKLWEKAGFKVHFAPSCYRDGLYGGTPKEQATEFMYYMTEFDCQAVIAMRGGYGSMRYIDLLDYDRLRKNPRLFVGYSDCTALSIALLRRSGLISWHGPMAVDQIKLLSSDDELHLSYEKDFKQLVSSITGENNIVEIISSTADFTDEGEIVGGNLTLLTSLLGTNYGLDADGMQNKILFLEDVGEVPYRLDRMFQQLRLAGILSAIKGVVLGTFVGCNDEVGDPHYDRCKTILGYLKQVRKENGSDESKVWAVEVETGHKTPHQTLPIGVRVFIDSGKKTLEWEKR